MKRQPMQWEKIFANNVTNKGLISKIKKQLVQLNNRPTKSRNADPNIPFSKKEILMTNRYLKRCSASLIIREMQVKTTMRYHLIPGRMATIRNYK